MATVKNPWEQTKTWDERMKRAAEQYATRPDFQYNLADDPLYNQYKEQYQRQGRLAMLDTMGQARANNGGYGTSYAMQAGQQAYNNQLAALNDRIPELYNIALSRYQNAGNDLLNRYNFAAQQAALEAAQNAGTGGGGGGSRKVDLVTEAKKVASTMGVGSAIRYIQQQIGASKNGEISPEERKAMGEETYHEQARAQAAVKDWSRMDAYGYHYLANQKKKNASKK